MPNAVQSIIRKATRKDGEPLNILCMATHERYQSSLAKTGHNFYSMNLVGGKKWNEDYAPIPSNYHILPESHSSINVPPWLDFDIIISQHKGTQFNLCNMISDSLNIPLISAEHMLPDVEYTAEQREDARNKKGDMNVFVSEYQKNRWNLQNAICEVNSTGIDVEVFRPLENVKQEQFALTVVNDFIRRDEACGFSLWKEITGFPSPMPLIPYRILGNTPGLSQVAPDIETLVKFYNAATFYLNTTICSSLPTTILEAMSCGCPVLSTDTCLIPGFVINHGENGFICKSVNEFRHYALLLFQNSDLRKKMGNKARQTILNRFSESGFVEKWNKIFQTTLKLGENSEN